MNQISDNTKKLLVISMVKGIGPAFLRDIASCNAFLSIELEELGQKLSIKPRIQKMLNDADWSHAIEMAEIQISQAINSDTKIFSFLDEEYPPLLSSSIKNNPCLIYVKGNLAPKPLDSVAIIGTRQPTEHGKIITERVTKFFVEKNWSIISGLALGCDAIAHKTAIKNGGHTIAVLAHGLQTIAPSQHKGLAEEILISGGALVSTYGFGVNPIPGNFVARDKIQAAMAQGVIMVQSDLKGGSLHASRAILEENRWLAVPYPTKRDLNSGNPKIEANLKLANGSEEEKAEFLKTKQDALQNLLILKSKDDYDRCLAATFNNPNIVKEHKTTQDSLI